MGILLTHGHIDHIGAIDAFKVPVFISEKEYEVFLENYNEGFLYYGKNRPYDLEQIDRDYRTGDYLALKKSIVNLIDSFDESVVVYPAHGDITSIGAEKKSNAFYQKWKNEQGEEI